MKHTKGEWLTNLYNDCVFSNDTQQVVAEKPKRANEETNWLNDAKLISAAPDLLEACEYVVKYHREHDSGEGELFGLDFVTTCIAAIRKAKGEK